ncbi:MAG: Hsp70 family protein [Planctomycetes bacterium]|nr:Hsp70 family protein [Planctomycetota bacterium]
MLEGLAEVDAGNQVLVRFDLDLDGILQVSAIERATGHAKSLVIDNAVERLRRSHVAPAADSQAAEAFRIDRFVAEPDRPLPAAPADSPELRAARSRAWELVEKARRLSEQANPQDAGDLRRVIGQIESAVGENSVTRVQQLSAELEDMVFYLEDA